MFMFDSRGLIQFQTMSHVKSLEHSTLKVPYEVLNKKFRNAQKSRDRESSHLNSALNELNSLSSRDGISVAESSIALDKIIEKLQMLKEKSSESFNQEKESAMSCKTRVDHLKGHSNPNKSSQTVWNRTRLHRMMVDYFLRSGFYQSAIRLAKHTGIEELVDVELFLIAHQVEDSLRNNNSAPCLAWCHENKSKLRKQRSTLELNVRIQEFVELIKANKRLDAVLYARKHFASAAAEGQASVDIQQTMALLAFTPSTICEKYKSMFDDNRWETIIDQFRKDNFALHQLNSQSMLQMTLQTGLSALKTPHCYHDEERNRDCPVCCHLLNDLARPLPFAHCAQSRLICLISGEPMDEHNSPLMLPNGHVYGETALKAASLVSEDGRFTCPATKERFHLDQTQKVFVM